MSTSEAAPSIIAKVGLWWPAADEGRLRDAATAWDTFATAVDTVAAHASTAADVVTTGNTGDAIDAFAGFWAKYDGEASAYLPALAAAARGLADGCREFADAVVTAKHKVEELGVEIGATLAVGTALAFFTFGIAEGAAAGVSAGLIAAAAEIGVELGATAAGIMAGVVTGVAFGAVESAAVDVAVAQPIRVEGFHDGGFSLSEVEGAFVTGGALGGLFGGAGGVLRGLRNVPLGKSSTLDLMARLRLAARDPDVRPMTDDYRPFGDQTPQQFRGEFWDPAARGGKGGWIYPPDGGALPGTETSSTLQVGQQVDRFGESDGRYLSPAGTPLGQRALPPDSLGAPKDGLVYHSYEVMKPLPVDEAKVAPWFDQPGGGQQYEIPRAPDGERIDVQWLVDHGYLRETR